MTESTSFRPRVPPLPGFGLPLEQDTELLFPTALDHDSYGTIKDNARLLALTLREISMLDFMNQVTDKDDWEKKVFKKSITNKWKSEATGNPDLDFTQKMADYCIDELKYKAGLFKKSGLISTFNGDVVKSDTAIPAEVQSSLKKGVAALENVPDHQKDWHPGSNEQVLDLVHPSLFPLVYGVSRILKDDTVGLDDFITRCGEGEITEKHPEEDYGDDIASYMRIQMESNAYSAKFQWLPCDVDLSGAHPKIVSYINNLHPTHHAGLYKTIEDILESVIPMWNATLTPLKRRALSRRVAYDKVDYGDEALNRVMEVDGPKRNEDEGDSEYDIRRAEWKWDHWPEFLVKPEPVPFSRPDISPIEEADPRRDYGSSGLQVIVKLANIHLTPENPKYKGGTWHIEGRLNEHICATAIYYYDCENITSSHLAFRQLIKISELTDRRKYIRNHNWWLKQIFGFEDETPAIQDLGAIESREGRLITFPNILQNKLEPMELVDPTRPGHRKILTFFLVDPNIKIISTANVPCQRQDWRAETLVRELGHEEQHHIVGSEDKTSRDIEEFPLSLDRAKELREELMIQRRKFMLLYHKNRHYFGDTISLY